MATFAELLSQFSQAAISFAAHLIDAAAHGINTVKSNITTLNGAGAIVEKANKSEFDSHKADNVYYLTGADRSGVADSTAVFNNKINEISVAGGGVLFVKQGTYLVNPEVSIKLKSNVSLMFDAGVIINSAASDQNTYFIILLSNCSNVKVVGNKTVIHGERTTHIGITGESGMGLAVYGGSNIEISGLVIDDCWGDGVYLSSYGGIGGESKFVNVHDNYINNCRRNGISVVECTDYIIENNYITNINGTAPETGIDLEPNAGYYVKNGLVKNNYIYGCNSIGITGYAENCIYNKIEGNTCNENIASGIRLGDNAKHNTVKNNVCINNGAYGITIDTTGGFAGAQTNYNIIDGNTCNNNTLGGIRLYSLDGEACEHNSVINNICNDNGGSAGIYAEKSNYTKIKNNTCISNDGDGIVALSVNYCDIAGNEVSDNAMNGIKCNSLKNSNVQNNVIVSNQEHGIYLRTTTDNNNVCQNTCIANGQKTDNTYSNIIIDLDSNYNNVQLNVCRHGGGGNQSKYGILIGNANCDGNIATNNDLYLSGKTGTLGNVGTGTVTIAGNR